MNQAVGRRPSGRSTRELARVYVPDRALNRSLVLPDAHRDRGIHCVAGSGSGKSLTLGFVAFMDFLRGVPQVVFDPAGQMIDAMLLRLAGLTRSKRSKHWRRIRYVDVSGKGDAGATAWPLLFELPGDSRIDIADRFLATCRAIDPELQSASIQGYNALYRVGAPTGVILSSLGLQLDAAPDLLNRPEEWLDRLDEAERAYPEARKAAEFFREEYILLSRSERLALTSSYRAKIEPILLDPALRAMLCAPKASIDFEQIVQRRQTVLLDFRHETNERKRLLMTRWIFDAMLAYIRHRGPGKHRPLAVHFDEITELTNQASLDHDLFARDLDYLFNVLQRNYACWITAAHQQMWQLSPRTQETLLSLGTQIMGVISDDESAEALARRFAPISPRRVKRFRNVWVSDPLSGPYVVEQEPVDFPLDEQSFIAARAFMQLQPFHFFIRPRNSNRLHAVSLAKYMGHPWPNEYADLLAHIRHLLAVKMAPRFMYEVSNTALRFGTMEESASYEINEDDEQLGYEYWSEEQ